jgi:putative ABC transport system ATP-binding protein
MVKLDAGDNGPGLIRARRLDKTYRRAGEEIHVLQGLNLDVFRGEFVAFMGPSGSGKTTLLNLLGGLDVPSAGSITVAGDEITRLSRGSSSNTSIFPRQSGNAAGSRTRLFFGCFEVRVGE